MSKCDHMGCVVKTHTGATTGDCTRCGETFVLPNLLATNFQNPHWIEWKRGDPMPAVGIYWATTRLYRDRLGIDVAVLSSEATCAVFAASRGWLTVDPWKRVIAYWSAQLPAPFVRAVRI